MTDTAQYHVKIAETFEEVIHAYCVRAICFSGEQNISITDTIDPNDMFGTQVILYFGNEPVGTVRLRWFHEFAKFERFSIIANHRNNETIRLMGQAAFDHAAEKGYHTIMTHATRRFAALWRTKYKFRVNTDKPKLTVAGQAGELVELLYDLKSTPFRISLNTPMNVLSRTEGNWQTPLPNEFLYQAEGSNER